MYSIRKHTLAGTDVLGGHVMSIIKLFSDKTNKLASAMNDANVSLASKREAFFTAVKTTEKVTLAKLPAYKAAFFHAYLLCQPENVQKILEDKTMNGNTLIQTATGKGKRTDKRGWLATIRNGSREWMAAYEQFLKPAGAVTKKIVRTERTEFARDVVSTYPRMAAYQKLEAPTTHQLEHRKLLQAVIDSAISHCPQAKEELAALVRKATKIVK